MPPKGHLTQAELRRARLVGLLAVLIGYAIDGALTRAVIPKLADLVRLVLALEGTPPELLEPRVRQFMALNGAEAAVWLGLGMTALGGFVGAALAGRRRLEHAIAVGVLSALTGVPLLVALILSGVVDARVWVVLGSILEAIPAAMAGGGVALLVPRDWPLTLLPPLGRDAAAAPAPPAPDSSEGSMAVPDTAAFAEERRFSFHGTGGELFGIHVVNMLLTFLTLGVYRFWAKVRLRKFLYSHTEFEGDRFEFHGTGKEALNGWSRAMGILGVPLVVVRAAERFVSPQVALGLEMLVMLVGAFVLPVAICGAWRYRLSRTEWRGLRFSFRGRPRQAVKVFLSSTLLVVLSLGLCVPLVQVNLHRFLVQEAYFGTRRFGFDGRGGDLVRPFALAWLGIVGALALGARFVRETSGLSLVPAAVVAAVLWAWYAAHKQRYVIGHTTFDAARLRSTVTGAGLLGLYVVNFFLVAATFGLGVPWAKVRSMRYAIDHLAIEGPLDLDAIAQDAREATATGEGIADVVDADAIDIGVGV
jgi:uncharacterized membrane protein YjgN (DUF898 family)